MRLIIAVLVIIVLSHFLSAYKIKKNKTIFNLRDFPPMWNLNNNLLCNFDKVKKEALNLAQKPISKIVIGKGDIYNAQRGKELLEEVKKKDSWTVGWDSGSGADNWKQYPIIYKGEMLENARKNLPNICALVEPIKDCFYTLFISTIKPFGEIEQHCDGGDKEDLMGKNRLTFHFNLDCPPTSTLNVEDTYIVQKDKQHIVFDSAYQHGVKNNSPYPRTILCAKFYISKTHPE